MYFKWNKLIHLKVDLKYISTLLADISNVFTILMKLLHRLLG